MKTLMILTAALAIAVVNGFSAPTAHAQALACSGGSFCTVFTTSTVSNGNLGGLAGADAICNDRAAAAGLSGTYKAWLADATGSPSTRFVQSTVPYQRTDGATVANSYNALITSGTPQNPINRDQNNNPVPDARVWTNVNTDGTPTSLSPSSHCSNWTAPPPASFGRVGNAGDTGATWTEGISIRCLNRRNVAYCFEQPVTDIPTLNQYGMITMAGVLGLFAVIGLFVMRRSSIVKPSS